MDHSQELIQALSRELGHFLALPLSSVSYYPTREAQDRIYEAIYGTDWRRSYKWLEEDKKGEFHVHAPRPFGSSAATGTFFLFLPVDGMPFGMMDLRSVTDYRPDLNRSIVSSVALIPNRLHNVEWRNNHTTFYVVDEEGSRWSIHCTRPKK